MPYGVGAPLVQRLAEDPSVHLRREVPRRLIERLRAGELDAALVSSIEAYRTPGYRALGDLGIACRQEARSVRAFRRPGPVRRVGLDDGSETSVALLKILLAEQLGVTDATFERIAPSVEVDRYPHDLVLLIGDNGLRAQTREREALDLGALWRRHTGMPFVFALWLIAAHADAERVAAALRRAAGTGELVDHTNGAIHYRLSAEDHRALATFAAKARALDLAVPGTQPTFLSP